LLEGNNRVWPKAWSFIGNGFFQLGLILFSQANERANRCKLNIIAQHGYIKINGQHQKRSYKKNKVVKSKFVLSTLNDVQLLQ